jgi:hypothetical protein
MWIKENVASATNNSFEAVREMPSLCKIATAESG